MQDINTVAITGNLTRDPELKHLDGGNSVCKIRVANNGRKKEGDEWVDAPNYFDVVIWGRQGEATAEYCAKGRKVAVTGKLRWREWEGDSGKRQTIEIHADTVAFMGSPKDQDAPQQTQQHQQQQSSATGYGGFVPNPNYDSAAPAAPAPAPPVAAPAAPPAPADDLPF